MNRVMRSLKVKFRRITIIPLVLFGLFSLVISSIFIYDAMRAEAKDDLHNLTHTMEKIMDLSGAGDYELREGILYRGGMPFDEEHSIVDDIKRISGIDATIFWGNERISTSIQTPQGTRAAHTIASDEVQQRVLKSGEEFFSAHVSVNDTPYFGYYIPLRNQDQSIVGMLFVGKARTLVMRTIFFSVITITFFLFLMVLLVSFLSLTFSRKIISSLHMTKDFLSHITEGDVDTPIDPTILRRDDEIGEMGRFAVMLQKSVAELINTDTLTGLYNRRSCTLFLESARKAFYDEGIPFTLVIGDIDDFKMVNDVYGHMAGDEVLKQLAFILQEHVGRNGIVARWGGEEFLFIFKRMNQEMTHRQLEILRKEIRATQFQSAEGRGIQVTMTFGVCEYHQDIDIDKVLKLADDKLYIGKEGGKDQVVLDGLDADTKVN